MLNGKPQSVYSLPPPTACPVNLSGHPLNLRVPVTEKPTVSKVTPGSMVHTSRNEAREQWC